MEDSHQSGADASHKAVSEALASFLVGRVLHGLCEQLVCFSKLSPPSQWFNASRRRRAKKLFSYFPISPICAIVFPFFSDGTAPM